MFLCRKLIVNFLWKPLSAVLCRTDELLLGEAEDTKTTPFRAGHYFLSLEDPARIISSYIWYPCVHLSLIISDETNLGTVDEQPTVLPPKVTHLIITD